MHDDNKNSEDKMLRKKALVYVISACIVIAFYFCVLRSRGLVEGISKAVSVLQPLIIGLVMAFLMNPIMNFFEKYLYPLIRLISKKETSAKINTRAISSIIALFVFSGIVGFFIALVIPELIETIVYLANHIEDQIAGVLDWCNEITGGRYEEPLMYTKENNIDTAIDKAIEWVRKYLDYDQDEWVRIITTSVKSVMGIITNIIIGMFVSVYILMSRETFKGQVKKVIYGTFKTEHANIILEVSRKSGDIFYGFIIGKILDSLVIGIICYVACLIMKMPYAVLVSVIIGITNIIPVFGPYIGAVPTVIIIFLTSPKQGIYFLIFVLVLQQFDGNLLGPKILGNSTGISSFWVLFAVVVGGGLFGVPGMIIGVPIVAIVYYLCRRLSRYMLQKKGLSTKTSDYVKLESVDPETKEMILSEEVVEEVSYHIPFINSIKSKKK